MHDITLHVARATDQTIDRVGRRDYSAADGVYVQGATRKAITLMVKDSKKYASTAGWGLPGVGCGRSHEANRHRLGETMLQLPCAAEVAGLHVLEVSRITSTELWLS